jgi:hypothetical protein
MQSGFSAMDNDADDENDVTDDPRCQPISDALNNAGQAGAPVHSNVLFGNGGAFGSIFVESVGAYGDSSAAAASISAVKDAAKSCVKWTTTDEDGSKSTTTVSALSFDKLGDETLALHMQVDSAGFSIGADLVLVRLGRCGISLGSSGLIPTPGLLAKMAPKAVSKLKSVCGGGGLLPISDTTSVVPSADAAAACGTAYGLMTAFGSDPTEANYRTALDQLPSVFGAVDGPVGDAGRTLTADWQRYSKFLSGGALTDGEADVIVGDILDLATACEGAGQPAWHL